MSYNNIVKTSLNVYIDEKIYIHLDKTRLNKIKLRTEKLAKGLIIDEIKHIEKTIR